MADIATPEVRSTHEVHEGVSSGIKITCQECFIGNFERRLECNSRKSFPTVVLLKGLCVADGEGRGPIKKRRLSEPAH